MAQTVRQILKVLGQPLNLLPKISEIKPLDHWTEYVIYYTFLLCVVLAFLCVFVAYFIWAENTLKLPAYSDKIRDYGEKIRAAKEVEGREKQEALEDSEKKIIEYLKTEYIECASENARMNDERSKRLKWLKRLIIILGTTEFLVFAMLNFNSGAFK